MIVHDAAAAFITIITAATTWIEGLAAALVFVLAVIAFAAAPLIAPTTRAARRPADQPAVPARQRPVPSWAHTQPYDYDEAA
ncbi:hypothetical protein [Streptomyces sp. NPDC006739]|uniref:hypothetical protein n=1 Tax=Streptomyces sp. NPDC006739 TaxID=3364763 RepID=UPI0036A61CAA